MKSYVYLFGAIIFEVIGTTMLKLSDGFSNLWPTIVLFICFGLAFTLLVLSLEALSLSLAYSVWSGLGTAGAGLAGVLLFEEVLSAVNILGLLVIIGGVFLMNSSLKEETETI